MSDTLATDRMWRTTVYTPVYEENDYEYIHLGPADFKLDNAGNLRIEIYPENSDFEVVIALHLANRFIGVSQEVLPEDTGADLDEMRRQLRGGDLAIKDEPEGSEFGD